MKKLLILVLALLFPMIAIAETQSEFTEIRLDVVGVIQSLELEQRIIVVSDDSLFLSTKVKVHSVTNQLHPISRLKKGDLVGLNLNERSDEKTEVVEVWILGGEMSPLGVPE